jgi:chromosome segregation ATPase
MVKFIGWILAVFVIAMYLSMSAATKKKITAEQTLVDNDIDGKKKRSKKKLDKHRAEVQEIQLLLANEISTTAELQAASDQLKADFAAARASNEELTGRRDELEIQKEQLKSDQIDGKQKLAEVSSSIAHAEKNVGKLRQAIKSVTPKE